MAKVVLAAAGRITAHIPALLGSRHREALGWRQGGRKVGRHLAIMERATVSDREKNSATVDQTET